MTPRSVLLIGATRGIGLALAKLYLDEGWKVVATTRETSPDLHDLAQAHAGGLKVLPLDIADRSAVDDLRASLDERSFDVLHIVAGMMPSGNRPIWEHEGTEILTVLETNAIGSVRLATSFAELVPSGGAFVFTSSGMGSMTRNDSGGVDLYRASKAMLNMLVRSFAVTTGAGRAVLLICPGWVKTDMGGPDAPVELSDSVAGIYRIVSNAEPRPEGAPFIEYSGDTVPW